MLTFMSPSALVVASASPRRRQLLALLGSPFEVRPPGIDEAAVPEPARAKARAVEADGLTVIAADTRIRLDGEEVGKPQGAAEAVATLLRLAGRAHLVVTDVAVLDAAGRELHFSVASRVRMRAFDRSDAEAYLASGEPLDAAGAYQVQGQGAHLVSSVDGCLANVVGLPLCHAYEALRRAGRAFPERPERACQAHFAFVCPVWRHAQSQARALRAGESYRSWSEGSPSSVPVAAHRLPRTDVLRSADRTPTRRP